MRASERPSRRRRSSLAIRTIERRALPLAQLPDRRPANAAGLAFARVDGVLVLEISGMALGGCEIAQRAAAGIERALERLANGACELAPARARDAAGGARRMDSGAEKRLGSVDVAHARDDARVHQELLHGHAPAARARSERLAGEFRREGLEAEIP